MTQLKKILGWTVFVSILGAIFLSTALSMYREAYGRSHSHWYAGTEVVFLYAGCYFGVRLVDRKIYPALRSAFIAAARRAPPPHD